MNPKYLHESLGRSVGPPRGERSRGGVERTMGSGEMENFSLGMFDNKTETVKEV